MKTFITVIQLLALIIIATIPTILRTCPNANIDGLCTLSFIMMIAIIVLELIKKYEDDNQSSIIN